MPSSMTTRVTSPPPMRSSRPTRPACPWRPRTRAACSPRPRRRGRRPRRPALRRATRAGAGRLEGLARGGAGAVPRDGRAYLEEQGARQRRGEPIDVEWVQAELARVRAEQERVTASVQRNLRLLVSLCAALLLVLWLKSGGLEGRGGVWTLGLIVIGALPAWVLGGKRR